MHHVKDVACRIYFDKLPDTREKVARFKGYLSGLAKSPEFRRSRVRLPEDRIAEVRSHDHVVLQCLDVVLGSIQFRLNDKHKRKSPGSRRRGKRTIAKERLYKAIYRRIAEIYPFSIRGYPRAFAAMRATDGGIRTGTGGSSRPNTTWT